MNLVAVILCGGTSRRMGADKAMLDFRGEPMLSRVVRLLSEASGMSTIACVAAKGQQLPPLPPTVQVVQDRTDDCGPLEGLASGLASILASLSTSGQHAEAVFVTTCDAPLLVSAVPQYLASLLGDHDAVVPKIDGQLYPLTAIYRPEVLEVADARLLRGARRVIDFVTELNVRYVSADELRSVDPQLLSLKNCNTVAEYEALLGLDAKTREH